MKHRAARLILLGLGTLLVIALGAAAFLLNSYQPPPVDPAWAVEPSEPIPDGAVTVRYTGTATLVFSDGETTWMTDGWFSRPKPLRVLFGNIEPDLVAITKGLERNEVTELAAVFPLHSHYDHAMDAPEVAKRTGALLLGSESTANIGRGWGLPETQIRVVADRKPIVLGKFTVTPIESRHFQFPDPKMAARALGDPDIDAPLTPPVGALGSQTDAYRESYWTESVERTNPSRVVPIHWDSLTGPIDGPFTGMVRAAALLSKGSDQLLPFLKVKEAANPGIELLTLPRCAPVVLF